MLVFCQCQNKGGDTYQKTTYHCNAMFLSYVAVWIQYCLPVDVLNVFYASVLNTVLKRRPTGVSCSMLIISHDKHPLIFLA